MAYILSSTSYPNYLTVIRERSITSDKTSSDLKYSNLINKDTRICFKLKPSRYASRENLLKKDSLANTASAILVKDWVVEIFERECPGKFQLLPAEILMPDGEIITDYKIVHVINKAPILDIEKSTISPLENKLDPIDPTTRFTQRVYRSSIIEDSDLCKDDFNRTALIFISNRLCKILKKAKINGMIFHKDLQTSVVFV
jgi:hypothetical protein